MLHLIKGANHPDNRALLRGMFRDRKRVFVDRMGWKLAVSEGEERDAWDDETAEYLVLTDAASERHVASLRLLRTDRPHLLDTIFHELCASTIPRGPRVREITRLCLPPDAPALTRIEARNVLARGVVDYALVCGVTAYTAVCNIRFLSQLLSAGWRCDPLGLPRDVNGELAGAVQIGIAPNTEQLLTRAWRCDPATPRMIAFSMGGSAPLAA